MTDLDEPVITRMANCQARYDIHPDTFRKWDREKKIKIRKKDRISYMIHAEVMKFLIESEDTV